MKRKQIYISEGQDEKLKEIAYLQNESESSIIRHALEEYITKKEKEIKRDKNKNPLLNIIGLGESPADDISENHDEDLYISEKNKNEK